MRYGSRKRPLLIFTKWKHEIKLFCFFTFALFKNELASPGFYNKEHKTYVNIMLVYFYIDWLIYGF